MNRTEALAQEARLFQSFGDSAPVEFEFDLGLGGGEGHGDRLAADMPFGFSTTPRGIARRLPPPAIGTRQIEGTRTFETIVSVPEDLLSSYRPVFADIEASATGPVTLVGHADARAFGSSVRRPSPDGEVRGTGCVFVDRSKGDGPELLTCAHVVVSLATPDRAVAVTVSDADAPPAVGAEISDVRIPVEGQLNDFDIGLVRSDDLARLAASQHLEVRKKVARFDKVTKWGAESGESEAVVEAPTLAGFALRYPECDKLVRFTTLIRLHSPEPFATEGDSGSLVWFGDGPREAVGMLIGGADKANKDGLWASYVHPMVGILKELKAKLV